MSGIYDRMPIEARVGALSGNSFPMPASKKSLGNLRRVCSPEDAREQRTNKTAKNRQNISVKKTMNKNNTKPEILGELKRTEQELAAVRRLLKRANPNPKIGIEKDLLISDLKARNEHLEKKLGETIDANTKSIRAKADSVSLLAEQAKEIDFLKEIVRSTPSISMDTNGPTVVITINGEAQ